MSRHMERTTVRLTPGLLAQAKRVAEQRETTVTALIEEGLQVVIAQSQKPKIRRRVKIPVSKRGGGVRPGVDLNNSAALLALMEGGD